MNRLLIVKLDGMGDYVLIHNYIDMLSQEGSFSGWHITMLCNDSWVALADTLLPNITCIPFDVRQYEKNYLYRFSIEQELNRYKFDVIIHPVYSRCFWVDRLIGCISSNNKISFLGDTTNMSLEDKIHADKYYHQLVDTGSNRLFEFERNRIFFESITGIYSYPVKPTIFVNPDLLLKLPIKNYVVIVIGAMHSKRKWCPKYYAELGLKLHETYGAKLVLCGGSNEVNESIIIERILGNACINLVGATSLSDMLGILSASTIVIGNDTGLLHLAVALDRPAVVISNGNHLNRFTPYPDLNTRYRGVFPFEIDKLDDSELNDYYLGSNLDINEISIDRVCREVSFLMDSLKLNQPTINEKYEFSFKSYNASAELFYRQNGNMFHFIESIKHQYQSVMVYGFSALGQVIATLLDQSFTGYVDQSAAKFKNSTDSELPIYLPEQLSEISFDIILISLLGREYAIEAFLVEQLGIAQQKILRIDI